MATATTSALAVFVCDPQLHRVSLRTREPITAICPFDGQDDEYDVRVTYGPTGLAVEASSFAEFLDDFAGIRISCEALAAEIARAVQAATAARYCVAWVRQLQGEAVEIVAVARA